MQSGIIIFFMEESFDEMHNELSLAILLLFRVQKSLVQYKKSIQVHQFSPSFLLQSSFPWKFISQDRGQLEKKKGFMQLPLSFSFFIMILFHIKIVCTLYNLKKDLLKKEKAQDTPQK